MVCELGLHGGSPSQKETPQSTLRRRCRGSRCPESTGETRLPVCMWQCLDGNNIGAGGLSGGSSPVWAGITQFDDGSQKIKSRARENSLSSVFKLGRHSSLAFEFGLRLELLGFSLLTIHLGLLKFHNHMSQLLDVYDSVSLQGPD